MALSAGTKLGPYEVLSPLGAGGMGEVYRARDSRLGREVAIKVPPAHVASAPDLRQRFEREARTISSLNGGPVYFSSTRSGISDLYEHPTGNNEEHLLLSGAKRLAPLDVSRNGNYEIYVQSFPIPGQAIRISNDGGLDPRWRRDGREIYFFLQRKLDGGGRKYRWRFLRGPAKTIIPVQRDRRNDTAKLLAESGWAAFSSDEDER